MGVERDTYAVGSMTMSHFLRVNFNLKSGILDFLRVIFNLKSAILDLCVNPVEFLKSNELF